jgi:hypothetical protein
MSESTGEAADSPNSRASLGIGSGASSPGLVTLCDHIVNWVTSFESTLNRVNYAEAHHLAECEVAAANEAELGALFEIMDLAVTVTAMHAGTQSEVEGKKRALDALTSIPAWERDSLYELRRSIERDQLEVNARLFTALAEAPGRVAGRAGSRIKHG